MKLSDLHAFKNHPFQVRNDEEMRAMVSSVKDKGVTQPAIVRPREDGGYEIVSGHRRQKASELAGYADMPCIIRNLTDEQAITQMVEDNTNQRENILPSERAKALKMQLEAIKHQGAKNFTSGQIDPKDAGKRSNEIVAERNKMTVKQVQRYNLLCKQTETEAKRLATALEIYVSGSLNIFNHKTNVGYQDARVVCFDLKRLGAGLRTIAMHIINDLMNSQVSHNFARGLSTWCYYDEFHVLLQDELTSSYFVTIWKMLRKKGCVPSALTQNVKDLLASRQIENIFENSDFMVLLSQAQGDRQILAKQLGISPHQLSYVTHSNSGEGLLFFGNVTIPFPAASSPGPWRGTTAAPQWTRRYTSDGPA